MKLFICLYRCFIFIVVAGCVNAAQTLIAVMPQGETLIAATADKFDVQVKIETREVQIGKPSQERPVFVKSSCTYSKYPCSLVDYVNITVNGRPLFIPRSVFCDLADLNNAVVNVLGSSAVLTLYGGDASESYVVKIEFDTFEVKRRVLSSAMVPDKPLQETIYSMPVLGD